MTTSPPRSGPSAPRVAWLAGATGLVGAALLPMLLQSERYRSVHVLVRRPLPGTLDHPKLHIQRVTFTSLPPALPAADDVYIALGTTRKVAGSDVAFRQVDFDFVVNTARAAQAGGARRLAVVSALGADARSGTFYNRVKGEMEDAVAGLGFESVVIAQPSLLLGNRAALGQPQRRVEAWALRLLAPVQQLVPAGIRPIAARSVAAALLEATLSSAPGVRVLKSRDMQSAGRN